MQKFSIVLLVLFASVLWVTQASALLYNQNVTPDVIFGSGVANGSFTVDRNNGVELGLRGKLRHDASGAPQNTFNSNGDGTYSFNPGVAPTQSSPTAEWSFEWAINTNWDDSTNFNLANLSYELGIDTDPGLGLSFFSFDPINDGNAATGSVQWDHAIGDNNTDNGAGTFISNGTSDASGYEDLIAENNVAQQSWKPHWFNSGFDPTVDGTYDFYLEAFDGTTILARTDMQIIVGQGGAAPIPEPSTFLLLGGGLAGLGFYARKRKKA